MPADQSREWERVERLKQTWRTDGGCVESELKRIQKLETPDSWQLLFSCLTSETLRFPWRPVQELTNYVMKKQLLELFFKHKFDLT